jgi:ubiquinol-cytochrome c reductase cytochrome b subunit
MRVFRQIWKWFDDRSGLVGAIKPMLQHLVPPRLGWWYVFGTATLTAFIVQVVTGIFLASMYVASPEGAFESLKYITEVAPVGNILRGIHYFGASAMVIFVVVHMIRVFLMAAYKYPRELSWLSGTILLALTLGMGFTGQLLRWDQNAIWSVVVGAEQAGRTPFIGTWLGHLILGGDTLNSATIGHIFSIHLFILPGLIAAVVGFHLYLVLRNGISERAKAGKPVYPKTYRATYQDMLKTEGEPFWPGAAVRDIGFATLVVAGIVTLAYFVGPPPVQTPPDPTIIHAQPRPDWYFLWYFAILAMLPHQLESYVMILFPLAVGVILIALPLLFNRGERSIRKRPWAPILVLGLLVVLAALTREGDKAPWSPRFDAKPLTNEIIGTSTGPVYQGAQVFNKKGCLFCHRIEGHGGLRGPDLSYIADRMTKKQLIIRIMNGADNMPAFAGILTPEELDNLMSFLATRTESGEKPATFTPGLSDSL